MVALMRCWGNPPWERVKLQEKEWFAERSPDIANAPNAAARKRLIEGLKTNDPTLYQQFLDGSRQAEGESHLLRNSGRYPLCGRGDINVYTVFAEGMRNQLNAAGRMGCVLPSGIATDDTTKFYFQDVVERQSLVSLFDFENKNIFPSVHSSYKFCLFTAGNGERPTADAADFVFFAHGVENLRDPERRFKLSPQDIALLNPNTRTCPIFRSRRDAELTKAIYRRVPIFVQEEHPDKNYWCLQIRRVFDMNKREVLDICIQEKPNGEELKNYFPMLEAKLLHQFDHRFASYDNSSVCELTDVDKLILNKKILPRYWVPKKEVIGKLTTLWDCNWLIGWRDITNTTNERTVVAVIIPFTGTDFTIRVGFPLIKPIEIRGILLGNLNSFVFDYCARQLMGGIHLSDYIIRQLPVLPPTTYTQPCPWSGNGETLRDWILPRVLELTYTAWDLEPFAQDCRFNGPPFRWDEARRFLLRCELDAAFFHLYGIERDDVAYIMDTFPIVKRKDEAAHGCYRTKDTILDMYDAMQQAMTTGQPYQTRLEPPAGDSKCCHPVRG
jgi:hypothetical protein